jgi:hypothetical protein
MPFGYFNKINKMRPNSKSRVVKKTQKRFFRVVIQAQFGISRSERKPPADKGDSS